jgi:hypothetical protein
VPTQASSKKREEGRALALGGHRLIKIPNNQLIVGGSSRGDVRAETHGGGRGTLSHCLGRQMEPHKKIYKIHWGFWQPPINDTHTTTNQKQAYAIDGGMDERRKRRESMGGYKYIVLAAMELEE